MIKLILLSTTALVCTLGEVQAQSDIPSSFPPLVISGCTQQSPQNCTKWSSATWQAFMKWLSTKVDTTNGTAVGLSLTGGSISGTNMSFGISTATGAPGSRSNADRFSNVRDAIEWKADASGLTDSTANLNNALTADSNGIYHNVYLPPGIAAKYHVTGSLTVHPGQCLFADNSTQVVISVGYDYNSAAGSPIVMSGNSYGTPCLEHVRIVYDQPDSIGTRANFATLAAGCGGNGMGCEYPAGIDLTDATNATIDDVFVMNAWDCVSANWASSDADTEISKLRCGAFDKGLNLSGSTGIVNLVNYHFYPWGISLANRPIYVDGNTYSAVFTSMGGVNATNYFSSQGRLLITGSAQPSFAYFTDPIMDQDNATFEVNSTSEIITIVGGHSVGSSTGANTACELNVTGGVPSIMVDSHMFRGNTDSAAGLICSAGGDLNISNSELVVAATGDNAIVQTGGNLTLKGGDIVATGTHTVPLISSTGGTYNISDVSLGIGGGSGVAISGTDSQANSVRGNVFPTGWTFTPSGPLGSYEGTGWASYTPTLTCNSGTLTTYSASASYQHIGNVVNLRAHLILTTVGSCTGNVLVSPPTLGTAVFTSSGVGRETAVTGDSLTVFQQGNGISVAKYDGTTIAVNGYAPDISISYATP